MRNRYFASVFLTTLVCFGMFGLARSMGWSPKLGLDLEGGLSVVYQPKKHVDNATLQTVVNIMSNRVNALGVSQPNITTQGGNIVVQLPGVKDARKVLAEIGKTAQLYFRPVLCGSPPYQAPPKGTNGKVPTVHYVTPPACPAPYAYAAYAGTDNPPTFNPPQQYAQYPTAADLPTTPRELDDPTKNVILPVAPGATARYILGPSEVNGKVVNGTIIKSAYAQLLTNGQWVVIMNLTGPGSTLFNDMAAKNYGLLLANDLDGQLISVPVIQAKDFNGTAQISGNFTHETANELALDLNYGALPVALAPLTTQTVSPSLGAASLHAGLLAGLLGLLLVMLYTIWYYRALGIVVVCGLITTAAFIYGFISMLSASSLGLTLDLSGVTGLIVSVGITVDSYIVYFERLKDEIRAGRSVRASVDRGFKSAFKTILSADAVSFIGALVLWLLSVGAVRGFAFMLGLSTLVDVVTSYTFTRPLVILMGRNRVFTEGKRFGVARGLAAAGETP